MAETGPSAAGTQVSEPRKFARKVGMGCMVVVLAIAVLALVTFGFVVLTSTSSAHAYNVHGDAFYYAKRQALWLTLGLAVCLVAARADYHCYRKDASPLLILAVGLLVAVLFFGKRINGATRWLVSGPVRFQPSEFAKYALVIALAFRLERMQRTPKGQLLPKIQQFWWSIFAAALAVVAAFCVIVVCGLRLATRSPDLSGVLLGSGIVSVIGLQAFINVAVATDTLPNKGMALPFVSYGGSNLGMTLAALGVLFSIFRQARAHAVDRLISPSAVQAWCPVKSGCRSSPLGR